ncbi:hypothetical protein MTO96_045658 [Rhipicephalus appendiculatus]
MALLLSSDHRDQVGAIQLAEGATEIQTVSVSGYKCMDIGVNYTCKLGICDSKHQCVFSNLYVDCWKTDTPAYGNVPVKSPVKSPAKSPAKSSFCLE